MPIVCDAEPQGRVVNQRLCELATRLPPRQHSYATNMDSAQICRTLRAVLLLSLTGLLLVSLLSALGQGRGVIPAGGSGYGDDPGIRVLLAERAEDRDGMRERVLVTTLQPALLVGPDDPGRWQLEIPTATRIKIHPQGRDGILVNIPSLQHALTWEVRRLALIPRRSSRLRDDDAVLPQLEGFEAGDAGPVFELDGRRYRGQLEIAWVQANRILALNALPIEAWVAGVLAIEMRASWPRAALMAQAVAARSYAFDARLRPLTSTATRIDLTDSDIHPSYHGVASAGQKIDWAVADTRGQVLTVLGSPFRAHFHASSGGHTAGIEDLDPGARSADGRHDLTMVMPPQPDPWARRGAELLQKLDSHWQRVVDFQFIDLREALRQQGHEIPWVSNVVVERHPWGRVHTVILKCQPQDVVLNGPAFRRLVGEMRVRSMLWSDDSPESPQMGVQRLTTFGWGHGVGLSQVSAYAMAHEGLGAADILRFFYLGSQVEQRW